MLSLFANTASNILWILENYLSRMRNLLSEQCFIFLLLLTVYFRRRHETVSWCRIPRSGLLNCMNEVTSVQLAAQND